MDELTRKIEGAGRFLTPEWDEDRAALVLIAVKRRARRRTALKGGAIGCVVLALAIGALQAGERAPSIGRAEHLDEPSEGGREASARTVPVDRMKSAPPSSTVREAAVPVDAFEMERSRDGRVDLLPNPMREPARRRSEVGIIGSDHPAREEEPAIVVEEEDETRDLLARADTARARGDVAEAIRSLRRIIEVHPADPRAPLAAFTLGRLQLDQGRATDAAEAFREARRLDPEGSLAEDALFREIESWSRANATERVESRGREYLSAYPHGRRSRDVRVLLGE